MGIYIKGNPKEGEYKLIKTTDGFVLEGEYIVYACIEIDLIRCRECEHWNDEDHWCNIRDSYGWDYKPTDFCSYGEREEGEKRADYTVFTVNPPKGIETPLKGDATVFHKNSKMDEKVARPTATSSTEVLSKPTATSSTEVPWWIGE